jgi:hypothetical protein
MLADQAPAVAAGRAVLTGLMMSQFYALPAHAT